MWNNTGNILLHRDDVGKSKPTIHKLPGDDFTYGAYNRQPEKTVKEIINEWQYSHKPGRNDHVRKAISQSNRRDYVGSAHPDPSKPRTQGKG